MTDTTESQADDERSPLLDRVGGDEGEPITREELERILKGDIGDEESLDSRQANQLIGKGSGLDDWGRGRVTVFVEGSNLLICDEEGKCYDEFAAEDQVMYQLEESRGSCILCIYYFCAIPRLHRSLIIPIARQSHDTSQRLKQLLDTRTIYA